MPSNEELAQRAKDGDREASAALWEQCSGFLYRVYERYFPLCQQCRCEPGDLTQTGYMAVLKAAQTFKPGHGSFLHWLSLYARTMALETLGLRKRQKPVLLSLDAPVTEQEDAPSLMDTLTDEAATEAFCAAEDGLYYAHVRELAGQCLCKLHPMCEKVIQGKFYEDMTQRQMAEEYGTTENFIRQRYEQAMLAFRHDRYMRRLAEYHSTPERHALRDYGLSAFRARGSGVEAAVIRREEIMHRRLTPPPMGNRKN